MTMVTLADGTQVPANDPRLNDPRVIVVQPPPPAPAPEQQTQTFTMEELIERVEAARKEEKDKLYETQEQLNARLKVFEDERQAIIDQAEADRIAAEEAERQRQQDEMSVTERYQQLEQTWQQRFDEQDQRLAAQNALFEKERQFQQLSSYRTQRLAELGDAIDPRFLDFVGGTTPEEIEASLYVAAEKTQQIGQEFQQWLAEQQGGGVQQPGVQPGQQPQRRPAVPVTGGPGYTPEQYLAGTAVTEQAITSEQIAAMPMGDYAANREALLAAASRQVQEKGLYG